MYKIVRHNMFLDEEFFVHLDVTKVKKTTRLKDGHNPYMADYNTFGKIIYRETKKEVFREFIKLMQFGLLEQYDTKDISKLTKELLEEFISPDTKSLYPEIFI